MWKLLARLRDVVWSAVLAVSLSAVAIFVAIFVNDSGNIVLALGLSSIVSALLAQRV